jgi:hypothetical protein
MAATYDAVPESAGHRPGLRSNGSHFTVESLGRYHHPDPRRRRYAEPVDNRREPEMTRRTP